MVIFEDSILNHPISANVWRHWSFWHLGICKKSSPWPLGPSTVRCKGSLCPSCCASCCGARPKWFTVCSALCRSRAQQAWGPVNPQIDWPMFGSRTMLTCHDWSTKHYPAHQQQPHLQTMSPRCDLCEHSDGEVCPEAIHKTNSQFVPQGHDPAPLQLGYHMLYRSNHWSSYTCKRQICLDLVSKLFKVPQMLSFFRCLQCFANIKLNGQTSTESLPAHLWSSRKDDSLNRDASALSPRSKGIVKNINNASSSLFAQVEIVWLDLCGNTNLAGLLPGRKPFAVPSNFKFSATRFEHGSNSGYQTKHKGWA